MWSTLTCFQWYISHLIPKMSSMLKIGMFGVNVPFPFGLCTSFLFSSLSIFFFVFSLEAFQCFKFSNVLHVFFLSIFFANHHHHGQQRKKNSFLSSSLFYLNFIWCVFLLQKKKKKILLFLPQKKNNFFLLLLLPRELEALLLPPLLDFLLLLPKELQALFLFLIIIVCYQRTLKLFFYKCNIAKGGRFFVMIHILLLNEE